MSAKAKEEVEDPMEGFKVDIMCCKLFPPHYDFKTVCSCDECNSKIEDLNHFEKFLMSSFKMVSELSFPLNRMIIHFDAFIAVCHWSGHTLDSFLNSLKLVYDELGEEFTEEGRSWKHKNETMKLFKSIAECGFMPNFKFPASYMDTNTTSLAHDIKFDVGSRGMYYYKRFSKFREEGQGLLNKILEIETKYQNAKKSAADNGKTLNPSISKGFLLQQIECLQNLPVEGLRTEAEDRIAKVSHIIPIRHSLSEAKELIRRTSMYMVDVRRAFWRKYQKKHKGKVDVGHEQSGLSSTLDELTKMAASFKVEWEKHFANLIPPPPLPRETDAALLQSK